MKHLWLASLLALLACGAPTPDPRYEVLTAQVEPLRAAFNAASGKVRAIFLAAPG